MKQFYNAEKNLREKYNIDILKEIILQRNDRAIYYCEFLNDDIVFTKIHGKSPLDKYDKEGRFNFSNVKEMFDMTSKYGDVTGQEYYKELNLNYIINMDDEANVTIPLVIKNQKFWVRFHLYSVQKDENEKPILASCYITDVTKYLIHEENLYEKTHTDELTGLFNRYTLYYHFELHGDKLPITSYYFDIDYFKEYNDTYGHDVGDKVLYQFAQNLKALMQKDFYCYRLGGDEFYCLLLNSTPKKAKEYISLLNNAIKSVHIPNVKEKLSISIGVVTTKGSIKIKYDAFMKEADRLMYTSKKNGKDRYTKGDFVIF